MLLGNFLITKITTHHCIYRSCNNNNLFTINNNNLFTINNNNLFTINNNNILLPCLIINIFHYWILLLHITNCTIIITMVSIQIYFITLIIVLILSIVAKLNFLIMMIRKIITLSKLKIIISNPKIYKKLFLNILFHQINPNIHQINNLNEITSQSKSSWESQNSHQKFMI